MTFMEGGAVTKSPRIRFGVLGSPTSFGSQFYFFAFVRFLLPGRNADVKMLQAPALLYSLSLSLSVMYLH